MAVGASGASQQDAGEQMSGDDPRSAPNSHQRVQTHVRQQKLGLRLSLDQNREPREPHEYPRGAAHEYQSFSVETRLYCLCAAEETGDH